MLRVILFGVINVHFAIFNVVNVRVKDISVCVHHGDRDTWLNDGWTAGWMAE